jgi:hypothetical protein
VIPVALAERLGLGPEFLELLRKRDERRKALRAGRLAEASRASARAAAAYAKMPQLRPAAPVKPVQAEDPHSPSGLASPLTPCVGGVPLTPRPPSAPGPSRRNFADGRPTQRKRGASRAKRSQLGDMGSLFIEPRHVRANLHTLRRIIRDEASLEPSAVTGALERALTLIPLAPSPDGLRRRLRALAAVLVARDDAQSRPRP